MQVIILIAFALTLTLARYQVADAGPWTALAVAAYLAGAALLSRVAARSSAKALVAATTAGPTASTTAVKRPWKQDLLQAAEQFWLVGGSGALMVCGYGRWVWDLPFSWIPLVGEIMLIAPFVAALLLTWIGDYPAHVATRNHMAAIQQAAGLVPPPAWSRLEHIGYNLRHNFLFAAVPVGLIILLRGVLGDWIVPAIRNQVLAQWVLAVGMVASACGVFVVVPALIVRIWRTATMPRGQLRSQLEVICRRMKLRYRDILIWRTGGMISNAGVMGLIPRIRYILMSDALLTQMAPHEVEAIFAHEAGHIVSHHILYSAIFATATMVLSYTAAAAVAPMLGPNDLALGFNLTALAVLVMLWGLGFGWLSRRFERQSDVIGAWAMGQAYSQRAEALSEATGGSAMAAVAMPADAAGEVAADKGEAAMPASNRITPEGAAIFARALQKVAKLNGLPYDKRNWRHGSIAWRVQYILWLGSTGRGRDEIDRLIRRVKIGLCIAMAASLAAWAVLEKMRG